MFRFLKRLIVVAFVLAVVGAGWVRNSPYWTLVEINHGLQNKDLPRIERVVDLERFVASSTAILGTLFAAEVGGGGTDPGGRLIGAVAGAFAKGVGQAVAKEGARSFRQAVLDGRVERDVGPLKVNDGFAAVGMMSSTTEGAVVEIKGTCDNAPASVWLEMERRKDGPFGGWPRRYVVVGVDADSVRTLAAQCRSAPASKR